MWATLPPPGNPLQTGCVQADMRKLALGAIAVAATGFLAVPVIGLAGSTGTTARPGFFKIPSAAADELPAFTDCDELLDWYITKSLPQVGPWGFGYPYLMGDNVGGFARSYAGQGALDTAAAVPQPSSSEKGVGNSETGTNVQEAGVDEPDVAKTDGRLVFRIDGRDLVVTDVTGKEPVELSRTPLPKQFWGEQLLLVGDHVVVLGQAPDGYRGPALLDSAYLRAAGNSRVLSYSTSDATKPVLLDDQEFEGSLVETRQYDETVRLVLQTGPPALDFVQPNGRRTEQEARRANREIVRTSSVEDWLPSVVVDGERSPLVSCEDVRHPRTDSGFGTITIVTYDAATPAARETVAVTTSGNLAYSSADRLYVATPVNPDVQPCFDCGFWRRLGPGSPKAPVQAPAETEVHAFALDGTTTTYVASGTVAGRVRDRWSFDSHDGYLRVATALTKDWQTTDNAVSVLRENGSRLRVVGSVRHLGPDEEIQSVRWFDDLAVVVTFRQIDPLYTVDLTNPTQPKVLGELKIPGFSSYLHPLGGDRLIGLGTAATNKGRSLGAQLATFDISRLRHPVQLSVLRLGLHDELTVSYDPRAFTYLEAPCPDNARCTSATAQRVFTTVSNWDGRARVLKLGISGSGSISRLDEYPARSTARVLPIEGGRVALVGDVIRLEPAF